MQNKRQIYPDVIKGIAIIMVVLGHNIQFGSGYIYVSEQLYWDNWLFKLIYSMHMPLFMLVSGYFFSYTIKKNNYSKIVKSRIKSLLIPIMVWSLIPWGISVLKSLLSTETNNNMFLSYFEITTSNLWFLWAILWNSLVVLLISRFHNKYMYFVVFLLLFVLPDDANLSLYKYMYVYFVVGFFWNQEKSMTDTILTYALEHKKGCVFLGGIVYLLLYVFFERNSYIYTTGISIWGKNVISQLLIDLYRWGIGFVGCSLVLFVVYCFMQKVGEDSKGIQILTNLGRESLGIYIVSDVINKYIIGRVTSNLEFNYVILMAETIIILMGCYMITKLFRRIKIARILLLGSR